MSFVDFEYNGYKLSDFGCMVCTFNNSGLETVSVGSKMTLNTLKNKSTNKFKLLSTDYDEPFTKKIQVCKHPNHQINGGSEYFTDMQVARMIRWLNKKSYHKFKPIHEDDSDNVNVFYVGTFNVSILKLGDKTLGLELDFTADAPFGYYASLDYDMDFSDITTQHAIYDISDEIGYIYPHELTITVLEDGDLEIMNSQETKYVVIKNCVAGEVITLDGENKIITSDKSHTTLHNDFNYNFIKIINTWGDNEDYYSDGKDVEVNVNVFTVSLPCTISLSYTPICKMGV